MSGPLPSELLVIELGERLGVSACCSLLADLGATVVLVEPARLPDAAAGKWPLRHTMAAGKLSVTLDGSDADNVAALLGLIEKADAIVTSSDIDPAWPPEIARALHDNPRLCDVTAFMGDAAYPPMSEGLMQAFTGVMDTTGDPDGDPTASRAAVLEIATGVYASAGILLARIAGRRYGTAQQVRISMFDCAISMMTTFVPRFLLGGEPKRIGNHHSSMSPWNAYKAADGWVLVCSGSNDQWKRVCGLLGRPELADDPQFESTTARVRANADVDRLMQGWISQFTVSECVHRLNAAVIPCGPVVEVADLFDDASLVHRGMVNRLRDPETGREVRVPGALFRSSRSRGASPARIPGRGEDNARVAALSGLREVGAPPQRGTPGPVLEGLRVIEIGQYTTAPLTARQLGAFGADVVKVEPPAGEPSRAMPPHREGQGFFFTLSNTDKRGIVVDLRNADDKALLAELIRKADILVENMKPGALAKFGFSTEELARLNPRLIYCAVSGFGADSPNSALGAMDTTIQAMSGLMDLTRSTGTPYKIGLSVVDIFGGQLGFAFILAALDERYRTGAGQFIDVSMQDGAAWITRTEWDAPGVSVPHVLNCKDGHVVCEAKGNDVIDLTGDARDMTREDVVRTLAGRGIQAAAVRRLSEVLTSQHVTARDLLVKGVSPSGVEWQLLNCPIHLSQTPAQVKRPMGPIGCDTASILADWDIDPKVAAAALARKPA